MTKALIAISGRRSAGKDFLANAIRDVFGKDCVVASISDALKQAYSKESGADFERLKGERAYKELHRKALIDFYENQKAKDATYEDKSLSQVVDCFGGPETILVVTGMRELCLDDRVAATCCECAVTVRVDAPDAMRAHGGWVFEACVDNSIGERSAGSVKCDLVFENLATGPEAALSFARGPLRSRVDHVLALRAAIRSVDDFPQPGVTFRDVLGLCEHKRALQRATALLYESLQTFAGLDVNSTVLVTVESGGFLFGGALAAVAGLPLAIIRREGKRPGSIKLAAASQSHISHTAEQGSNSGGSTPCLELSVSSQVVLQNAKAVVLVGDTLASGTTAETVVCALKSAFGAFDVGVLSVIEFPKHRGRQRLLAGFTVKWVKSLLTFEGC